ncbi:hypothetical protein [Rhodovibrio sodomensis]|uniref:hypothetical protein n=1 Tax=Rhodovibrio sodomensis TaxID=1088 RepID=UPI0019089AD0|nr:hypothetical protein [Rhodovibrio sodomensis]
MHQEIEAFLTSWVQRNPPQPRKSGTQVYLERLIPTITNLRSQGYSWPQLATMLAAYGLTDAHGQAMKAETLRRKAFRAGYREPAAGRANATTADVKLNKRDERRSEGEDQAETVAMRSRPAGRPAKKAEGSTSSVFTAANERRRPRCQEELTPYTTADVTQDANQNLSPTEGEQ